MIQRTLEQAVIQNIYKQKAIIIIGPRQVGKTTLVNHIKSSLKEEALYLNCDEIEVKNSLTTQSLNNLKQIIGRNKLIIIDEAQRIRDIGLTLKLIIDNFTDIQIIVTGSSSFELSNRINEPLTGRKFEFNLFPFSFNELKEEFGFLEEKKKLNSRLIYGLYPDVVNNHGQERIILNNLASSYLYKDLISFQDIRKPDLLNDLLQALALQVGSEVSYMELSKLLGTDKETIARYISLLEKVYIIFRLKSFNRNIRTELKKSRKIYFYDNGIRNAIIGNFTDINLRTDNGALWENFLIAERIKTNSYSNQFARSFFWRTSQKQEIDYVEEIDGKIKIFEFKWNPGKSSRFPLTFMKNYKVEEAKIVNPENYWEFI